ncbi:MAG: NUDIX domain-containing protein [Sulfitobacter sp.]
MTKALFFYGSLRDLSLLDIVLGRPLPAIEVTPTHLDNFAVFGVKEGPFPMLVAQQGAAADGVLVSGLTDHDIDRLNFYEGGFSYDLIQVTLANGTSAQVYFCPPQTWTKTTPWDFDVWADDWADMSRFAAEEVMGHYGKITASEVAEMFGQIRARAWSKVLAQQPKTSQEVFAGDVEIRQKSRAYTGYFAVDEINVRHAQFDGSMSPVMPRSYFVAGDAALVLPYDPVRDRVLLVEQIRMGPLGRSDPEIWHLEPIAGRIDPGESAEQTARREAVEESGLALNALETVSTGYSSPGDSTGYFHIFVGVTDLPDETAGVGGLASEHENIRSRLISFDKFFDLAETQALANTPVTLLAYWLAHHRSRLRSAV